MDETDFGENACHQESEINKMNQRLNWLKGIACIGIVFIHIQFPTVFGKLLIAYARAGVALFFIISGYYSYYSDLEKSFAKNKTRLIRNLKRTLWAFGIYFVWGLFVRYVGAGWNSVISWIQSLDWREWTKLIIINEDIIIGHLWFMLALIYCYILLLLLEKYQMIKMAYRTAPLLCAIAILFMVYMTGTGRGGMFIYVRNVWFYGMPMFLAGHYIHHYEKRMNELISVNKIKHLLVVSLIIIALERCFIGNLQFTLGSIGLAISAFVLALRYPDIQKSSYLVDLGSKMSMEIYIYHWIVKDIFIKLSTVLNISQKVWFIWSQPVMVLVCTIFMVFVIDKTKDIILTKYYRWREM